MFTRRLLPVLAIVGIATAVGAEPRNLAGIDSQIETFDRWIFGEHLNTL